jgi:hypothetical protein
MSSFKSLDHKFKMETCAQKKKLEELNKNALRKKSGIQLLAYQ